MITFLSVVAILCIINYYRESKQVTRVLDINDKLIAHCKIIIGDNEILKDNLVVMISQQFKKYVIENEGAGCPMCGGKDLDVKKATPIENGSIIAVQVHCKDCGFGNEK